MAYLDREQAQGIYYEDNGSGADAVVLVHGWGTSVRAWDYNLTALLDAGYRVVALDHRGCGQSDKDFSDMGINAIAGDVVALVESLGLERVVLNGWSLGGAVSVEAASQLGERCAGLVLTCAATPAYLQKTDFPHGGTEEILAQTLAAMKADRVNFLAALAQGAFAGGASENITRWLWQLFLQGSPLAAQSLADLGPLDQRALLASLKVPILSVVGGQDAVVDPAVCRSVADYNANTRTLEFADSGHSPFIEEAPRYNEELIGFVRECF